MNLFITGGAGFIGVHTANYYLSKGNTVTIFDNFSRKGTKENVNWLKQKHGTKKLAVVEGDIRHFNILKRSISNHDVIIHLAGQVAVTTSIVNPREDFEINALGTFNVLEAVRLRSPQAVLLFASTNKVYGGMEEIKIIKGNNRYKYRDYPDGIPETQNVDFHSPYGCCYSENTDILTKRGWKKFYELTSNDMVLTYNLTRKISEFQKPTKHFSYNYKGKMYVQVNRRLKTCVTPNHKMLVSWDCNHNELERPRLIEAEKISGKPMAYLLAADFKGGRKDKDFILPDVKIGKHKHHFPSRKIPIEDWLKFLGWYLSEGHCYESKKTRNCTVTLTTYYRKDEALAVMKAIGLSPVIDNHHIVATSRQLYEYVKTLGKSHTKFIPQSVKDLNKKYLLTLLKSLLDGDGNPQGKNGWRYTTVSKKLADDVQEIAIKCGYAAAISLDKQSFFRVYICSTKTAQCNLDGNRSRWIDYSGKVYCVEVPNSVMLVRQNGRAYFSGNSKGAADQYIRDYHRIYGLKTVVFRQSCIYGTHQFGIEDQGWVSWFTIAAILGKPITVYGDGMQVRDVLFVEDLVNAYDLAIGNIKQTAGQIYNVGGGAKITLSLLELLDLLEKKLSRKIPFTFADWRPGDQPVYISNIAKITKSLDWQPKIGVEEGTSKMIDWIVKEKDLIEKVLR